MALSQTGKKHLSYVILAIVISIAILSFMSHMAWLGELNPFYDTVKEDNFSSEPMTVVTAEEKVKYISSFLYSGHTIIQPDHLTVQIQIHSNNGEVENTTISQGNNAPHSVEFKEYRIKFTGFFNGTDTTKRISGKVKIISPHKINSATICVLHIDEVVSCSTYPKNN